jgi:DNA-binding transcriptional ArsR family regulator
MSMEHLELLLHPIRMRMILALANRVLTTQQLADLLPEVAQTTLYRHINILLEGGILTVVRESKVRGTIERELTLVQGAGRIDLEVSASLTPEQHEQIFTTFIATLLAEFRQIQSEAQADLPPAFYTRQRLYMTVDELLNFNQQMETLLSPYQDPSRQATGAELRHWQLTGIVMPDTDPLQDDKDTNE